MAGACLRAYRRGEETPEAVAGSLLDAEFMLSVTQFLASQRK